MKEKIVRFLLVLLKGLDEILLRAIVVGNTVIITSLTPYVIISAGGQLTKGMLTILGIWAILAWVMCLCVLVS